MVTTAAAVEWTVVGTEVEALQLEYSWIKEYDPRFNVKYRDDKSYPYLAVTLDEEFPRVQVDARRRSARACATSGRTRHAWAIRETLDLLLRVFPVRTCSTGVFKRAGQIGRPCLLGYIGKCSAPCVGRVTPRSTAQIAEDFCDFMAGQTRRRSSAGSSARCSEAADELDYERAARLRDDIGALERALEKNAVVLGDGTDADVIALAEDELEAAVQVFHVRGGRVRGQRGWVVEKVEDVDTGELVEHFLLQLYGGDEPATRCPREVLVPALPADADAVAELAARELRGRQVDLRVPQRGDKRALHGDRRAQRRAGAGPAQDPAGQRPDHPQPGAGGAAGGARPARGAAAHRVLRHLAPPGHRRRRLDGGLRGRPARKSEYRRFAVRGRVDGAATTSRAMHEVITRRFRRYLEERADGPEPELGDPSERRRSTTDGSDRARLGHRPRDRPAAQVRLPAQLRGRRRRPAAGRRGRRRRSTSSASTTSRSCGLAKRLEEVWLPGEDRPGDPAAHQRGAVPAAAGPRRGAPVRHHLPPAAAVARR